MKNYVLFSYHTNQKVNITKHQIKKESFTKYMNYKQTRDELIGKNKKKKELIESDYLEKTAELFESGLSDEDFVINLQIISALTSTRNTNAKPRIKKYINIYFKKVRSYVERLIKLYNEKNDILIDNFENFLVNNVDKEYISTGSESDSEEEKYEICEWRESQRNSTTQEPNVNAPSNNTRNTNNHGTRVIRVDLEQSSPTNVRSLQYVYDEINNSFILGDAVESTLRDLSSTYANSPRNENGDASSQTRSLRALENAFATPQAEEQWDNLSEGTINSNSDSPGYMAVSTFSDGSDELINVREIVAQSARAEINSSHDQSEEENSDYLVIMRQRDEQIARLVNQVVRRRIHAEEIRYNVIRDPAENPEDNNTFDYDEAHVPVFNDIYQGPTLTTADIERISARFPSFGDAYNYLHSLTRESISRRERISLDDLSVQRRRNFHVMNNARLLTRVNEHLRITFPDQTNNLEPQVLATPLVANNLRLNDDISISDSQNASISDERHQDSDLASHYFVNVKNSEFVFHPTPIDQHLMNLIFQSFFHIINKTSFYSDEILLFLLWFIKNNHSSFLETIYRKTCIKEVCMLLKTFLIRRRTSYIINKIDYIKNFELNEFNIRAYKDVITKGNAHIIDFQIFSPLIIFNHCSYYHFEFIECYINYIKYNQDRNKEEHYLKIIRILKKNCKQNANKAFFLLSKLALHCEEAQYICSQKSIVEITTEVYKQQLMVGHNTKYTLLCIYCLCELWEQNRKIILKRKVMPTIFDVFKRKLKDKRFDKEFLAIVCLIKSMTRCVLFLRSDLIEFPIVELFLMVVKNVRHIKNSRNLSLHEIFDIEDSNDNELCSYLILKESFCVLSNLVMDFGNYKIKFINKNGLQTIYKAGKKTNLEYNLLFLLKNFVYESTWQDKQYFMNVCTNKAIDKTGSQIENNNENQICSYYGSKSEINRNINLSICQLVNNAKSNINKKLSENEYYVISTYKNIFTRTFNKYNKINLDKINRRMREKLKTLKEAFNIVRNIVCSTKQETYEFFNHYPYLLENIILYFIRLLRSANFIRQKKNIIIEIIYIFSNICANTDEYKDIFVQPFFTTEIRKLFTSKNRDIMLAMIWFITNLSWAEDENGQNRNKLIVEAGYKNYLLDVKDIDKYIKDKVVFALGNLKL